MPSTGPLSGWPYLVTVASTSSLIPCSRSHSCTTSTRRSSVVMRRKCSPARSKLSSSNAFSALRSSGVSCIGSVLDERQFDDSAVEQLAAHIALHRRADLNVGRNERERDRVTECRREVAARDDAHCRAVDQHRRALPSGPATLDRDPPQATRDPALALGRERVTAAEVA